MTKITSIKENLRVALGRGIESSDLFHDAMEIPTAGEPLRLLALGPTLNWQWETHSVA